MDSVTQQKRSEMMRAVKPSNTKPEVAVRQILHRLGFRFRLHRPTLPGKPDIVLPKWQTVVFVHGCFWHRHPGCPKATTPKSRKPFWNAKFKANIARDARALRELADSGWNCIVVWQCELSRPDRLAARLKREITRRTRR